MNSSTPSDGKTSAEYRRHGRTCGLVAKSQLEGANQKTRDELSKSFMQRIHRKIERSSSLIDDFSKCHHDVTDTKQKLIPIKTFHMT